MSAHPPSPGSRKHRVAVVYHYFAHYRQAIMEELYNHSPDEYVFVADTTNYLGPSIEPWTVPPQVPFVRARCWRLWGSLMWQQGLMRLALRRDIDTIIFLGNPFFLSTWLAAPLARATGKQVLFWTIGWIQKDSVVKDILRRTFYDLAHSLLLYGHFAKQTAILKGFSPARVHVVYNSLDYEKQRREREQVTPEKIARLRSALFEHPEWPIATCVSRLGAHRRLEMLLEAAAILQRQGRPLNVLLVGEGPDEAPLRSLAQKLNVPVCFFGACYDETKLAELLMASTVTVAPGMVGLTAMQSLAYGVPVITHDDPTDTTPEFEAILPGTTGDFFRKGDTTDLARVIDQWTQTQDVPVQVRNACYGIMDRFYNPQFQRQVIDRAVAGHPADDLFWLKSPSPNDAEAGVKQRTEAGR